MGSHRSSRRQERAREFGRRHPRVTLIMVSAALAGVIAICAFQLSHGAYLGRGWVVAAVAGMVTAAGLSAAALISNLRHGPAWGRMEMAWLVLGVLSASAIRYPFPYGPYSSVQAFFNVVHAALLGYEAVTCAALIALFGYLLIHPRGLPGRLVLRQPPVRGLPGETGQVPRRPRPRAHRWPAWVLGGAVSGLVAGVILAVAGGPDAHDAARTAGGWVILLALAAVCVAAPAALYRRYRLRRAAAVPPSPPGTTTGADASAHD